MRQIIAMGGGGFLMEPENPLLDKYVLEAAGIKCPTVCYLPTACGDADFRIEQFYRNFNRLECRPRHLSLFRQRTEMTTLIKSSDVIYVGGGNTRFMLAIWKACGLDKLLREQWEKGTVLCGVSAGAICWFEAGSTDSDGPLAPLDCMGFLSGSCCPHYDGEPDRRPSYHRMIKNGELSAGLALDDGAAAHFVEEELSEIVTSRPGAAAFLVELNAGEVLETPLPTRFLGDDE